MSYEEKCLALDKQLAELLDIYQPHPPRWTLDDAEAFRLMVEYRVELEIFKGYVKNFRSGPEHFYKEYPTKESAVRHAIVQAVINKLSQSDNSNK